MTHVVPTLTVLHTRRGRAGRRVAAHTRRSTRRARSCSPTPPSSRPINQGKSQQVPLLALRESDGPGGRREARGARGRRSGARDLVGHGGDVDGVVRAAAGGRRSGLQRGDLRRDAPPHRGFSAAVRRRRRGSRRSRSSPSPTASSDRRPSVVWFESPINPTLRCVDIARVAAACRAKGVMSVDRQHVRQPGQSAAARAGRRPGDALGDEVPERPQRRHRRRARRVARRSSIGCSRRASCSAACSSRRPPTRWRAA